MARYIDVETLEGKINEAQERLSSTDDKMWEINKPYFKGLAWARSYIENQPTADVVEVKHGEWDVNVGMNFNKERICPICKKRIESNYWEFCSHCGAKMDGGNAE